MAFEALKSELMEDIAAELQAIEDSNYNEALLRVKVNAAIRDVKTARKYPSYYTERMIDEDMERFYSNIRNIALYDYNQTGAEGLSHYSADGATMTYVDRSKLFSGVIPLGSTS